MPLSRRAFLQLAALGTAGLLGNLRLDPPSTPILPLTSSLRLLTTGRPILNSTLAAFTATTGLAVHLIQDTHPITLSGFDLAIIPAHNLTALIRTSQVQELNATANSDSSPQRPYDPFNAFSLLAGQGAIGINARGFVHAPTTWTAFFDQAATTPTHLPPAETFHAALKSLGQSLNTRNTVARNQARALIANLSSVPLAQAQLALGPQLPHWQFAIPTSGAELWEDCYCIPTTSPQPQLAHTFLRFVAQHQPLGSLPASPALEPRSSFAPTL